MLRQDPTHAVDHKVIQTEVDCYLPLKALSAYSGMSIKGLRKALTDPMHPLPHYRPGGGKILVRLSDFDRWMARSRRDGSDVDRLVSDVLQELTSSPRHGRSYPPRPARSGR